VIILAFKPRHSCEHYLSSFYKERENTIIKRLIISGVREHGVEENIWT
jgi:hypothetical protein